MTTLTSDQQHALDSFKQFYLSPDTVAFLLEGGAGVGKTFLLGEILRQYNSGIRCAVTPTHKATNVLRRKLDAFGVRWCRGYDSYTYDGSDVITGTSAQLLGIGPVIVDDQTEEVSFGKTGRGILSRVTPRLLVIDEVSMLGAGDFIDLLRHAKSSGMKLLAIGDEAQLPPVKRQAIPFQNFKNRAALRRVVRQAEGSNIIALAWLVRENKDWRHIKGGGVRQAQSIGAAFAEVAQKPGDRPEEEREVFIAYRNRRVDEVQEIVCRRLYGHGAKAFHSGEMVLSETNFYRNKELLCANQDELLVVDFYTNEKDKTLGTPVLLRRRHDRNCFRAHYLPPEEMESPGHPYRVELRERKELALRLQAKFNDDRRPGSPLDKERRRAWAQFYEWRDATVLSFRHPFAITSHKAQGSTYRSVYVDVADIHPRNEALYVAVTRPREELVLSC